jgi:transcriptional regulator with XRE-family HTH domain
LLEGKQGDEQSDCKDSREFKVNEILREKDVSKLLGVSVSTLRRWRRLGNGPIYRKLNGAVRYAGLDLQKFIDDRARLSTVSTALSETLEVKDRGDEVMIDGVV